MPLWSITLGPYKLGYHLKLGHCNKSEEYLMAIDGQLLKHRIAEGILQEESHFAARWSHAMDWVTYLRAK